MDAVSKFLLLPQEDIPSISLAEHASWTSSSCVHSPNFSPEGFRHASQTPFPTVGFHRSIMVSNPSPTIDFIHVFSAHVAVRRRDVLSCRCRPGAPSPFSFVIFPSTHPFVQSTRTCVCRCITSVSIHPVPPFVPWIVAAASHNARLAIAMGMAVSVHDLPFHGFVSFSKGPQTRIVSLSNPN